MTDIDPTLRWRLATRIGTRPESDRRKCPDADTLALLIVQPEAAPVELLQHVERCSACSAELRSFEELPELSALIGAMTSESRQRSALIPIALAICLVVAVGVAGIVGMQPTPRFNDSFIRSAPVLNISPEEGAVIGRAPDIISWSAFDGHSYRMTLYDDQAHRLWTSEATEASEVELPEAIRSQLKPGRYFWQVQVIGAGTLGGPFTFEIDRTSDGD